MENAFKMEFFNSAKFFNNAKNQLEFTKETRFARYQSKFSLIFGIKKKFCFVEKIFHFLSEAKFFFNAKNQREFTQVTSEASFLSKFKLILGIIKKFG